MVVSNQPEERQDYTPRNAEVDDVSVGGGVGVEQCPANVLFPQRRDSHCENQGRDRARSA